MYVNPPSASFNPHKQYAYLRHYNRDVMLIVVNFDDKPASVDINIPEHAFKHYHMNTRMKIRATDMLTGQSVATSFSHEKPSHIELPANGGVILKFRTK